MVGEARGGLRCLLGMVSVGLMCWCLDVLDAVSPSSAAQQKTLTLRRAFLGLDKCNACVGTTICKKLFKDQIRFDWWMSPELTSPLADQQRFPGNLTDDSLSWRPVVMSFLSSPDHQSLSDRSICRSVGRQEPCSIEAVLRATPRFQTWRHAHLLLPHMVEALAPPLLRCPSQRLLGRVVRRYAEVIDVGSVQMKHFSEKDKLRLLYTLAVNQHPFMLQMFPGTEGWPFPRYHGSCGRLMVWASGRPLSGLYGSSVEERADAAFQLLHLTQDLGSRLGFHLYYTQLRDSMFGLQEDGRVVITDASTIGVIDLEHGPHLDTPSTAPPEGDIFSCLGQVSSPCLWSPPCSSVQPSQSLTLLCQNLLPRLLHPSWGGNTQQEEETGGGTLPRDVPHLLAECADPSLPAWRILGAAQALKGRLGTLRPCRPRLAYRFPECRYNPGY